MKKVINSILTLIGLMLSPITWWNDPFVNIPISYLAASILAYFSPKLFSISFLLFYWFTNILGIYLLYMGGKGFIESGRISRERQVITVFLYSILILLLSIFGFIRPFASK